MSDRVIAALRKEARWLSKRADAKPDWMVRETYYNPRIENAYQCPSCFIRFDRRSELDSFPTGTRDDGLECAVCGADFIIAAP